MQLTLLAALAFVLSGCFWPAPGAGPDRRAHNPFEDKITPATVADLEQIWEATTSASVDHAATSKQAVHITTYRGWSTLAPATGAELWSFDVPDEYLGIVELGPLTYSQDALWTSLGSGSLGGRYTTERVDPLTGDLVEPLNPDGIVEGVRGSSYLLRRLGYFSDVSSPLTLSLTIGDLEDPDAGWSETIDVQFPSDGFVPWSASTLGTDNVYQAGPGFLDADVETRGNAVRGYPIDSPPNCQPPADEFVCPTWATELDGDEATSPVLGPGESTLYTATDVGTAYAVDTSDGTINWSASVGTSVTAEPALADGNLYVPTSDGRLVVLDAATGSVLWEADAGNNLPVQPAVAGGVVYTGAQDGSLQAFDAAGCGTPTCDPLWSTSAGGAVTGAPAVNNGQLYVGTNTGLVAYALPG